MKFLSTNGAPDGSQMKFFNRFSKHILLVAISLFSLFTNASAQPGAPCNAYRWTKGGHWDMNCTVNDANNAPHPKGVIRCANAAGTESGIDNNDVYDHTAFEVIPNNCTDPDDLSPVNLTVPFDGQKIAWFNFDVRPGAPSFDFQCIATGNYELEWALYYSMNPTCSTGINDLSGNCSAMSGLLACGTDFNGWSPQPYSTPNINLPTNLYLVVWRKGATITNNPDFDFTFKARYGCGTVIPCLALDCPSANGGTYQCVSEIPAEATTEAEFEDLGNGADIMVNCPGTLSIVHEDIQSGSCALGTLIVTRTYTITFTPSNGEPASMETCTQVFILDDTTPPTFSCPAAITLECDQDASDLNLTGTATLAADNCGLGGNVPTYSDDVAGLTGCNGTGVILRTWNLMDACGNAATSCTQTITIQDTTAPTAFDPADVTNLSCVGDVPCPTATDPTIAGLIVQIQANSEDNCGDVTVSLQSATALQTCSDSDGDNIYTFGRIFTFSVSDACGNHSEVSVNFSGTCQPICTYTQGAWGNAGGAPGATVGMTDQNLITTLINTYGTDYGAGKVLRIGANNRYLDVKTGQCVIDLLPGGGTPGPLASMVGCNKTGCAKCNATSNDGSLKNNLANNTIALQLNIWFSKVNWDNNPNTNWDLGNESLGCISTIPSEVLAKMAQLQYQNTVYGLLAFTNAYLGGGVSGVSSSFAGNLTNAVTTINERWDNCVQPGGICNAPLMLVSNLGNPTFHAWKQDQKVNLRWFIRHSDEVDHFIVERSIDGVVYSKIANLLPSESVDLENYVAVDNHPEKGINHYQLVIYLKSGEVETMPEVEIEFVKTKPYSLLPNPATSEAWLDLTQLSNRKDVTVILTNCYGQEMLRMQIDEVRDDYPRLDLNNLKDGMYFVTVKVGREIYTDKLIVTKME